MESIFFYLDSYIRLTEEFAFFILNGDAVMWKQKNRYLIAQCVVSGCLNSERPLVLRRRVLQILPKCNKRKHTSSYISWFGSNVHIVRKYKIIFYVAICMYRKVCNITRCYNNFLGFFLRVIFKGAGYLLSKKREKT